MGYKNITKQKRQKMRRVRVLSVLILTTIVTAAICFKYIILDEKKLDAKVNLNEEAEVVNTMSDFSYISEQKTEAQMNTGDKFDFTSKRSKHREAFGASVHSVPRGRSILPFRK